MDARLLIQVDSTQAKAATADLKQLESQGAATEKAVDGITGAALQLAAAFALFKAAEFAKDQALLAARFETMDVVMVTAGHNAGKTSDYMHDLELKLQKLGISALQSRNNLAALATGNIELAHATDLARAAQDVAVVADLNSSEAFTKMVTSIKSGLVVQLHHMGLQANYEQAYQKMAASINKSTRELTEQEKVQARVNAVIEAASRYNGIYEDSMSTAGKQIRSMERYTEDLKVQLGEAFGPAVTTLVFALVDQMKLLNNTMKEAKASGDLAITQMKIKDAMAGTIQAAISTSKFLYEHRDAIGAVAGAYASLKVGQIISGIVDLGKAAKTTALASVVAAQAKTAADLENATSALAVAAAERDAALAEVQRTGALSAEVGALSALDAAEARHLLALEGVTAAQTAAAASSTAGATASGVAGTAIAGLGGPLTVLIGLLGAAVAAWYIFKDSTEKDAADAAKNARERIADIEKQLEANKRYWAAIKEGKTKAQADEAAYSANDDPAIRKLDEQFGRLQSKLKDLQSTSVGEKIGKALGITGGLRVASTQELNVERQMNEIIELRETMVERLNAKRHEDSLKEQDILSRNKGMHQEAAEAAEAQTFYAKQIADLNMKTNEELSKGIYTDKESLAIRKAEEETVKRIAEYQVALGEGKIDKDQFYVLATAADSLQRATVAAVHFNHEMDNLRRAQEDDRKETEGQISGYEALRDQLWPAAVAARKLAEGIDLINASIVAGESDEEAYWRKLVEISKLHDMQPDAMRAQGDADSINKRYEGVGPQLAQLEKLKEAGLLLPGSFEKSWVEIMRNGETTFSYLADAGEKFANTLGDAFAAMATNSKANFTDMINSFLRDASRAAANRAFQQLFNLIVTSFFAPSGAGAASGNSLGGGLAGASASTGGSPSVFSSAASPGLGAGMAASMARPGGASDGQGGVNVSVVVNVEGGKGGKSTAEVSSTGGDLGNMLGGVIKNAIAEETRNGGIIYNFVEGS